MKAPPLYLCVLAFPLAFANVWPEQQEALRVGKTKPAEQARKSEGSKKPQRKRVVTDLSGFDLLEPSKLREQTTVVGATRGLPQPVALAPRLGRLLRSDPTFAWSYEGKASNYIFVLWDDAKEEIFRAEVGGATYQYPAAAPELEAGKMYFWAIEVTPPARLSGPSSPVGLIVVSPSQRAEIEKGLTQISDADPYRADLARARVFTDFRLWYDALAAYSALISRYPNRAELYEQRGTIYAQVEATRNLAERDFAQAEELNLANAPP